MGDSERPPTADTIVPCVQSYQCSAPACDKCTRILLATHQTCEFVASDLVEAPVAGRASDDKWTLADDAACLLVKVMYE